MLNVKEISLEEEELQDVKEKKEEEELQDVMDRPVVEVLKDVKEIEDLEDPAVLVDLLREDLVDHAENQVEKEHRVVQEHPEEKGQEDVKDPKDAGVLEENPVVQFVVQKGPAVRVAEKGPEDVKALEAGPESQFVDQLDVLERKENQDIMVRLDAGVLEVNLVALSVVHAVPKAALEKEDQWDVKDQEVLEEKVFVVPVGRRVLAVHAGYPGEEESRDVLEHLDAREKKVEMDVMENEGDLDVMVDEESPGAQGLEDPEVRMDATEKMGKMVAMENTSSHW